MRNWFQRRLRRRARRHLGTSRRSPRSFERLEDRAMLDGNELELYPERLTDSELPAYTIDASVSDDGDRIAVISSADPLNNGETLPQLYVYDLPNSQTVQITSGAGISMLSQTDLSGDGRWVAFTSWGNYVGENSDGNVEVFLYDLETDAFRQVTHTSSSTSHSVFHQFPALSADGSRVAYQQRIFAGTSITYRVLLHDWAQHQATVIADSAGKPAINADGTRVAFSSSADLDSGKNADGNVEIFLYDANTQTYLQVTDTENWASGNPRINTNPSIDGAGERIGYIGEWTKTTGEFGFYDVTTHDTRVIEMFRRFPHDGEISVDGTHAVVIIPNTGYETILLNLETHSLYDNGSLVYRGEGGGLPVPAPVLIPDGPWIPDPYPVDPLELSMHWESVSGVTVSSNTDGTRIALTHFGNWNRLGPNYLEPDGNLELVYSRLSQPPTAVNDRVTIHEDEATAIDILANDLNPMFGRLDVVTIGAAEHGQVTFENGQALYVPDSEFSGSDRFFYALENFAGLHSVARVDVDVHAVNDLPEIDAPLSVNVDEDGSIQFSQAGGNGIEIRDVDVGNGQLNVEITAANGRVRLGEQSNVPGNSRGGVNEFYGNLDDINQALEGMTFRPNDDFFGQTTIEIWVNDNGATGESYGRTSSTHLIEISVDPVNDPPQIQGPATGIVDEDHPLVFSSATGNGLHVTDVDIGESLLHVTITSTNGTFQLASDDGLQGSITARQATFQGAMDDVNSSLEGLVFRPNADFYGRAEFEIHVDDGGATGSSNSGTSDSHLVIIDVMSVNDAPLIVASSSISVDEDVPLVFSVATGNEVSIWDVDAGDAAVELTLRETNGTITLAETSEVFVERSGDKTRVVGSLVAVNRALDGLQFTPLNDFHGAAAIEIVVDDRGNTGYGGILSVGRAVDIAVAAVNDAPTIEAPSTATVDEDTLLVFSVTNGSPILFRDDDAGTQAVAVGMSVSGGDLVLGDTSNVAVDHHDGILTLIGSLDAINAVFLELGFQPHPNFNGNASLDIILDDLGNSGKGGPLTDEHHIAVEVLAVNDAPQITVPDRQTAYEDVPLGIPGISVVDIDAAESGSLVQVDFRVGNGNLTITDPSNSLRIAGNGTPHLVLTGKPLVINGALAAGLTYLGDLNFHGTDKLLVVANDLGNTGAPGELTDMDAVSIDVLSAAQQIGNLVTVTTNWASSGELDAGNVKPLLAGLWAAQDAATREHPVPAIKMLMQLKQHINLFYLGKGILTDEQAAELLNSIEISIASLSTGLD